MIKKYKENLKGIKQIEDKIQIKNNTCDKEIRDIGLNCHKQIRELQRERDNKIYEIELEQRKKINSHKQIISDLTMHVNKVERILEFIDIYKNKDKTTDFKIEINNPHRHEEFLEIIEEVKNKYLNLQVVIAGNNKPKNKHSLCIIGKHIFNKKIIEFTHDYLPRILNSLYLNIGICLKEASDIDSLKQWYIKNKDKVLNAILDKYYIIEQEYDYVKENYIENKEWTKLYLEWKIYYYEHYCRRGTEQKEYKDLKKQLLVLQDSKNS